MATPLPEGTITLLFTDIEGSTAHLHRLGDHYATLLADQRTVLRAAFAKWNGHEVEALPEADATAAVAHGQRLDDPALIVWLRTEQLLPPIQ